MVLVCEAAPHSGLSPGVWGSDRVLLFCSFSVAEACWQSEEEMGLYSWPRSTHPSPQPPPQDSLGTLLPCRALKPKLLLTPKRTSISLIEDMVSSTEAPEEGGDGEQENESKWGHMKVGG